MSIVTEYIWLDADNNFRSKMRVTDDKTSYCELWNYDGSSTNQATTESSEIILKPVCTLNHPFIDGKLNICATYDINNNPLINNYYHNAKEIFNDEYYLHPWFGLEQEYFIYKDDKPLGYNDNKSNIYYCSHINQHPLGVKIAHEHLTACIKAGIKISGINAEVVPGQWEFQIGPVEGINAGNHMMAARYLLERIAIKEGVTINYHPKPINDSNGSGCHVNFSTKQMREDNGYEIILDAVFKLEKNHDYHMIHYGKDNNKRMTGHHETASYSEFTWGVGSRNTSIRIGYDTFKNKKGYFEDRRPASNIDPYLVTSLIFKTCCLP
jgi:glutamine synthetase